MTTSTVQPTTVEAWAEALAAVDHNAVFSDDQRTYAAWAEAVDALMAQALAFDPADIQAALLAVVTTGFGDGYVAVAIRDRLSRALDRARTR